MLWACDNRLSFVRERCNQIGTNILVSQQGEPFPHQESSSRVLDWSFLALPVSILFLFSSHLTSDTGDNNLLLKHCSMLAPKIPRSLAGLLSTISDSFSSPSPKMLVFPRISSSNCFPYSVKSLWDFPCTFIASIAPTKRLPIPLLNSNLVNTTLGNISFILHIL